MLDAVKAWEEAYLLEPTNLRAREFLRSALERIHAVMSPAKSAADAAPPHPWLPAQPPAAAQNAPPSAPRQPPAAPVQAIPGKPKPAAAPAPAKPPAPPRRHSPGRDHLAEPRSAGRLRPRADRRRSLLRRPVRDLRPQAARHRPHPLRAARAGRGPGPGPRPGSRQARSAAQLAYAR